MNIDAIYGCLLIFGPFWIPVTVIWLHDVYVAAGKKHRKREQ